MVEATSPSTRPVASAMSDVRESTEESACRGGGGDDGDGGGGFGDSGVGGGDSGGYSGGGGGEAIVALAMLMVVVVCCRWCVAGDDAITSSTHPVASPMSRRAGEQEEGRKRAGRGRVSVKNANCVFRGAESIFGPRCKHLSRRAENIFRPRARVQTSGQADLVQCGGGRSGRHGWGWLASAAAGGRWLLVWLVVVKMMG